VAHACNPSYSEGRQRQEDGESESSKLRKTLSHKQKNQEGLGHCSGRMLKHQALGSIPHTEKKKKSVQNVCIECVQFYISTVVYLYKTIKCPDK
jgi:hypothetical protein